MVGRIGAGRDAAWYEREYNPSVPGVDEILAAWPAHAARARGQLAPIRDLRTGDHPRETLDLFRAADPQGVVVFIHGGFWRVSSKDEMSWVAEGFLGRGYSVALLNYPLCPDATLEALTTSVRQSFARLWLDVLSPAERGAIVVTGHSAGGYLAAALMAADWQDLGLPERPFDGVVAISGLFELAPLIQTSHNRALRLDLETAERLSLTGTRPKVTVPLALAVGEHETGEFHRQSEALAQAWAELRPDVVIAPGADHYAIVEDLSRPGSELHSTVMAMLEERPAPSA